MSLKNESGKGLLLLYRSEYDKSIIATNVCVKRYIVDIMIIGPARSIATSSGFNVLYCDSTSRFTSG